MQRIIAGILITAALVAGGIGQAAAAARDYVFEPTAATIVQSTEAIISVRLLNKATGKPVMDAVIFQQQLDMSPENMAEMTGTVTPLPASEPGIYRFKADLSMVGRWALKLSAKVPGEPETVRGEVVVAATK